MTGPSETTRLTPLPTGTVDPAAGFCEITAPSGTVGWFTRVTAPVARLAEVSLRYGKVTALDNVSRALENESIVSRWFVAAGGTFTYGSYPDIEGLVREQAGENDPKRREATLQRIQQVIHDKAMFAPIWELAFLNGHGPRIAESGLTLIPGHPYSAPYEDLKLKTK